jgi:hypothetical protein
LDTKIDAGRWITRLIDGRWKGGWDGCDGCSGALFLADAFKSESMPEWGGFCLELMLGSSCRRGIDRSMHALLMNFVSVACCADVETEL